MSVGPESEVQGRVQVSILVTCFNRVDRIARAITSIVEQDFDGSFEIIVVDDASEDESIAAIERVLRPQDRMIVRSTNGGQNAALNTGLREARGEIIAFCDSDDWFEGSMLSRTIGALEAQPNWGFVYACLVGGRIWDLQGCDRLGRALEQGFIGNLGALVARRSALEPLLPLPERLVPLDMCQDDRIFFELARHHCFGVVQEPLYNLEASPNSVTKNTLAQVIGWDRLFTDYRDDVRTSAEPGTLARHRVKNLGRAAGLRPKRLFLELACKYVWEALRGPRTLQELSILAPAVTKIVGKHLRSYIAARLGRTA